MLIKYYLGLSMVSKKPLEALQDTAREISRLVWGRTVPQTRRDLYARVLTLVKDHWKPKPKEGGDENDYRDELKDFLYNNRKSSSIHISPKEGFSDLVIIENDRPVVALELKLNLKGKGKIRTLRDQMEEDAGKCDGVITVLLGKTPREDSDLVGQKARKLEKSTGKPVRVIRKDF